MNPSIPRPRCQQIRGACCGLLLCALIAGAAALFIHIPAFAHSGPGVLTLAIVGGIVAGNLLPQSLRRYCQSGINLSKHSLLRLGIILYGFNLTFQQIADIGLTGIASDLIMLISTFLLTCFVGLRVMKADRQTVWLIGAGSSICGAAAILATAPVVKADAGKVAVAVATVVFFGTAAIFIYPLLWEMVSHVDPQISPQQFGLYTGSTIHEVAQVVAAGHAISPQAENSAVIAKMLRVIMLAPFLLVLGQWLRLRTTANENSGEKITFPWFAVGFIAVAGVNSLGILPAALPTMMRQCDSLLLAMAMAALGLGTCIKQLLRAGKKPLLLGLVVFIWLMVGGAIVNLGLWHVLR